MQRYIFVTTTARLVHIQLSTQKCNITSKVHGVLFVVSSVLYSIVYYTCSIIDLTKPFIPYKTMALHINHCIAYKTGGIIY